MKDRDWVSTAQVYQSSLKTPGEARATSQQAWDTGIAEGVRQGLFGLGEVKDEKPVCDYFKSECMVSFTDSEVLIKAEIAQRQMEERQAQTSYPRLGDPSSAVSAPLPSATSAPAVSVPSTKGFKQLAFNFTVPKGKVASLMGVLNYLQSKYGRMDVSLNLQDGEMSEQEFEDKVKEAFRQMGIEIE